MPSGLVNDKRSRLISLTVLASERRPKAKAVMDATSRQALAGFSKEEKEQLATQLARVSANLDRLP